MTKDTKGVRQVLEAVIVVGFLYGIQSDLLPKEEVEHRIAGFKNTKAYKEAEAALQEIMLGMLPEKHVCSDECNIKSNEWRIGHRAYKDAEHNVIADIKSKLIGKG